MMQNELAEQAELVARILAPSSWAVMDSYLKQAKRKYRGQNVGWPADQFQHKESMAKAIEILEAIAAWNQRTDADTITALQAEIAQLRDKLARAADIFNNCSVEAGVCCCGDNMENHPPPMNCGHSPVDQGSYSAGLWLEDARQTLADREAAEALWAAKPRLEP